ncbi:hypothetical protein J6590_066978 [Homalodisca vitripennis]|nr:hypothetical protein J6590_100400 [Homalodisca vitripennis]KAG8320494.1 hypothetical protein J6590_066978 [Homalodisca vitripennis]
MWNCFSLKYENYTKIDKPLAKKPAQKQISEQPRAGGAPSSGGEWDKHLLTYPEILRFGVRLVAKWQWPGQGIERAGECREVVGIIGEDGITAAEGYLPQPA